MQFAGIKKQWSKRQILIQLITSEYHNDLKKYLILQEAKAGEDAYFRLKSAMVKQLGPRMTDGFDTAIARVMNGTPSQLGRSIINDICPITTPLTGCHCANVVLGIWRRSLPQVVRNQIADMEFTAATYINVFDRADMVWSANSASTSVVAPLAKPTATAETAAVQRNGQGSGRGGQGSGRGGRRNNRNRGNSRNQNGGSGSGQSGGGSGSGGGARDRGPRHSDNPPSQACDVHWRFGKSAWHCADRHGCPWRDFEKTYDHPRWREVPPLSTLQQIIWVVCHLEDPHPHSHRGEKAQVHTMQLFI